MIEIFFDNRTDNQVSSKTTEQIDKRTHSTLAEKFSHLLVIFK